MKRSGHGQAPLFYVHRGPDESHDEAGLRGADWIMAQPGDKLVLVVEVGDYRKHPMAARTRDATVAKRHTMSPWSRGPVLAPWPTSEIVGDLADDLGGRATALCVIPWGDDPLLTAWLRARRAVHIADEAVYPGADGPLLDPVVEEAMIEITGFVNHANALTHIDKAYTVRALQELHAAGYRWNVDGLCGWALANGFTGSELPRLRDFASGVVQGRRIRLDSDPLATGAVERWLEAAARRQD